MKYDFDAMIDRSHTDTLKWSRKYLGENFNNEDALPLWVADMDFKVAQPIIDALVQRAQHGIFGYGHADDAFLQSAVSWQKRRNDWDIEKEWILYAPGIVPALGNIVNVFCQPGDNVLIQSPVYYPFYNVIRNNGCNVVSNQLIYRDGRYEMDFDGLAQLAADEKTTLMILCSPHNPVGRVWLPEELERLAKICRDNNVLVVADEIHSDLIYKPNRHTPFAKVADGLGMKTIVCTAPSKTFNLAGLQVSDIIVSDEEMRKKLHKKLAQGSHEPNSFAAVAQIAAYNEGEEWLDQLMEYLERNIDYIEAFVRDKMPRVKFTRPEGTYLAWLDFTDYGLAPEEMQELMQKKAGIALDDGYIFGKGGETFQRINFACPRSILQDAMERINTTFSW